METKSVGDVINLLVGTGCWSRSPLRMDQEKAVSNSIRDARRLRFVGKRKERFPTHVYGGDRYSHSWNERKRSQRVTAVAEVHPVQKGSRSKGGSRPCCV